MNSTINSQNIKIVKLKEVLNQYRVEHWIDNNEIYKQVTITRDGNVFLRGEKIGAEIGRKRQFIVDLEKYPKTLLFIRQTILDGGIGVATEEVNKCVVTENFPTFEITDKVFPEYLNHYFRTFDFNQKLSQIKVNGSAQKAIHERDFLNIEFPLPTLEIQLKIVSELTQKQAQHKKAQTVIEELKKDLKFLRQSILQQAVQGELVNSGKLKIKSEETGSDLLNKIKAEKLALSISKGKKEKPLPQIKPEEIPFEIPENWTWCRFGEVLNVKSSKRIYAEEYIKIGIPFYRSMEIGLLGENKPITVELFISNVKYNELKEKFGIPKSGDILIACIGGSIGNTWIVDDREFYYKDGNLVLIESIPEINIDFLLFYLKSSVFLESAMERVRGTSYNALTIIKINNSIFPLPPLSEQKLIVEEVEKQMQKISEMENKIAELETDNNLLWKSIMQKMFKFSNAD